MIFYVTMATFQMTLLMNNFTDVVIDDWNLDEIHGTHQNKVWYIMHPNIL
jgi:hypothetical protein